jgi:hypothetical protein
MREISELCGPKSRRGFRPESEPPRSPVAPDTSPLLPWKPPRAGAFDCGDIAAVPRHMSIRERQVNRQDLGVVAESPQKQVRGRDDCAGKISKVAMKQRLLRSNWRARGRLHQTAAALLRRDVRGLSFVTDANTNNYVDAHVRNPRGCSG